LPVSLAFEVAMSAFHAQRVAFVRRMTVVAAGVALLACAAMSGCYEKIVGARGPGADQYSVSERYQESSTLDNWIWGEDAPREEYRTKPGIRTH
jgi:hypothetical protein